MLRDNRSVTPVQPPVRHDRTAQRRENKDRIRTRTDQKTRIRKNSQNYFKIILTINSDALE